MYGPSPPQERIYSQIDQEQVLLQLQISFLPVEDVRNQTMIECTTYSRLPVRIGDFDSMGRAGSRTAKRIHKKHRLLLQMYSDPETNSLHVNQNFLHVLHVTLHVISNYM